MKKINTTLFLFMAILIFTISGCSTNETDTAPRPDTVTVENQEPIVDAQSDISVTTENSEDIASAVPQNDNSNEKQTETNINDGTNLEVHFIDVGQADAALLISDGHALMIDGGNVEDSSLIYSYLNKLHISHLDYMIGTHAHEDHMGGLSGALQKADVGTIYIPKTKSDAKFYKDFLNKASAKGSSIINPTSGTTFQFGGCSVQLLCPQVESSEELNNTSILAKITCGSTSFLFTGDAEYDEEHDILSQGYDLSADVLKAGHHGSDTSSSYSFLREIMPKYVVVSVGKNNSYGHPNENALSRFRDVGATVYRTDLQGDIIFTSNGNEISVTTQKNENADTNPTIVQGSANSQAAQSSNTERQYIGNKNSKKFHRPSCHSLPAEKNRVYLSSREEAIEQGFDPCKNCNP